MKSAARPDLTEEEVSVHVYEKLICIHTLMNLLLDACDVYVIFAFCGFEVHVYLSYSVIFSLLFIYASCCCSKDTTNSHSHDFESEGSAIVQVKKYLDDQGVAHYKKLRGGVLHLLSQELLLYLLKCTGLFRDNHSQVCQRQDFASSSAGSSNGKLNSVLHLLLFKHIISSFIGLYPNWFRNFDRFAVS